MCERCRNATANFRYFYVHSNYQNIMSCRHQRPMGLTPLGMELARPNTDCLHSCIHYLLGRLAILGLSRSPQSRQCQNQQWHKLTKGEPYPTTGVRNPRVLSLQVLYLRIREPLRNMLLFLPTPTSIGGRGSKILLRECLYFGMHLYLHLYLGLPDRDLIKIA